MKSVQIVGLAIAVIFQAGCASQPVSNQSFGSGNIEAETPKQSFTSALPMAWKGPDGKILPMLDAVGWIESQIVSMVTASGSGASRSYNDSSPNRVIVLRCQDGRDFVITFVDPKMASFNYIPGPAYSYKISGQVGELPQAYWDKVAAGINPFETMDNHGVVGKRDVTHMIFVKSIQRLK